MRAKATLLLRRHRSYLAPSEYSAIYLNRNSQLDVIAADTADFVDTQYCVDPCIRRFGKCSTRLLHVTCTAEPLLDWLWTTRSRAAVLHPPPDASASWQRVKSLSLIRNHGQRYQGYLVHNSLLLDTDKSSILTNGQAVHATIQTTSITPLHPAKSSPGHLSCPRARRGRSSRSSNSLKARLFPKLWHAWTQTRKTRLRGRSPKPRVRNGELIHTIPQPQKLLRRLRIHQDRRAQSHVHLHRHLGLGSRLPSSLVMLMIPVDTSSRPLRHQRNSYAGVDHSRSTHLYLGSESAHEALRRQHLPQKIIRHNSKTRDSSPPPRPILRQNYGTSTQTTRGRQADTKI